MLSLNEVYTNDRESEKMCIQRIEQAGKACEDVKGDIMFLWHFNKTFAIATFFLEGDLSKSKYYFYVCGLLSIYMQNYYGERVIDYGIGDATFALLSDDECVIQSFSNLNHPWFEHTIKTGSLIHAIQNIIKGDWKALERDIAIYEKIANTQKGKINIPDLMFFKGMQEKDERAIGAAIHLLIKDHKKRNKHMGIAQEYISIPALTYTKLAWRHGFELDIDHPLIPKALLPVHPLPEYKIPYKFLQDWFSKNPL